MSFEFGAGTLYISNPDGSRSVLGDVNEAEIVNEDSDIPEYVPISSLQNLEASFELVARVSREAILAITGVTKAVLELCPNKRVVHLAVRGRKKRTRKKNLNRAIKILEELE